MDKAFVVRCCELVAHGYDYGDDQGTTRREAKGTDTQYWWTLEGEHLIIGFPGSVSLGDWWRDCMIARARLPGYCGMRQDSPIRVHAGFVEAYASIAQDIRALVGKRVASGAGGCDSVVVLGHSLGGALAVLCAVDLQFQAIDTRSVACLTWGQPRVGNRAWAESTNGRLGCYIRYVNRRDPVPGIPWVGYEHAGFEVRLGGRTGHGIEAYLENMKGL
jgi:triacylglycerol lipase